MPNAHDLRLSVDQVTETLLQQFQRKLFAAPDLPPLNKTLANMDEQERYALEYWLRSENLDYLYIQLKDEQGKSYNASYLDENDVLKPDFYVSAFESSSALCTDEQQQQIAQWIDEHPEFQGINLENMEDYGVKVSMQPVSSNSTNTVAVFVLIVSLIMMVFFTLFGIILFILGTIWVFMLHQQDKNTQKLIDLNMWRDTLKSRMESYLEHQIQAYVQEKYALVDETEQQAEDDNVKEYQLPEHLQQALSNLESSMFIEVEDEQGVKQMKSIQQLKQEHKEEEVEKEKTST